MSVVVLGDLARSPRMCLHALALAAAGFEVDVLAYTDTAVPSVLAADERVRVTALPTRASPRSKGVRYLLLIAPTMVVRFVDLARALLASRRSSWIVVQNPPALPALPILLVLARRQRARLVVDWHNFGWTILGMRLGRRSVAVAVAGWLERVLARGADLHLCVSEAMRRRLSAQYGIEATVFRDCPARVFSEAARQDRSVALSAVLAEIDVSGELAADLRDGTARLLVSSTSWSADEDFSLLLDALRIWSRQVERARLPPLIVVVSGLGPLRERFENEVARADLVGVAVRTTWLPEESYPRLLAAADLGVCLHRSSSGVDLPMKLADMAGACLPACALDYGPCLREAMGDRDPGLLFETAAELAAIWTRLLVDEPEVLARMRDDLLQRAQPSWQDHWVETIEPLLRGESNADLG